MVRLLLTPNSQSPDAAANSQFENGPTDARSSRGLGSWKLGVGKLEESRPVVCPRGGLNPVTAYTLDAGILQGGAMIGTLSPVLQRVRPRCAPARRREVPVPNDEK